MPNELLCLKTAANCGIDIPLTAIIDAGEGKDEDILLASRRFDRIFTSDNEMIDKLPIPFRLHQEDFAQALGIPQRRSMSKAGTI